MREFLFARVPRDEREETGGAAVVFWTQNSSESLCFFLAGAERAGNLDENVGFGQVDGEIPHFGQHNTAQRAAAEAIVDSLTFRLRRLSVTSGTRNFLAMASIWARYSPMIRIRARGWPSRSSPRRVIFAGFSAAMRNWDRLSARAYSIRRSVLIGTRSSTQVAPAIQAWRSRSFQGTSKRLGPMRAKTSASRSSSRARVAVRPRRRRA